MRKLLEKKNALLDEMEGMLKQARAEVRAFSPAEESRVDEIKEEIRGLEKLIALDEEARSFEKVAPVAEVREEKSEEERALEVIEAEERAFVEAIKTGEIRNLTVADNGGVIPSTVINKIIDKVYEKCPIASMVTRYNVKGDLVLPVHDTGSDTIVAEYATEFQDLAEKTTKFTTVTLKNNIIGVLTKVSKSLINRAGVDVLSFVINEVASEMAKFLEKELLTGNQGGGKIVGALQTDTMVKAANQNRLVTEDLVDLQMKIPTAYQADACWIMHKDVLTALRKLKDTNGNFLLQQDLRQGFGWSILGKPVYISDNMPSNIATDQDVMLYGDFKGMSMNITSNASIDILKEKYAAQYALGVVAFMEADAKITNKQMFAKLQMAS